jgi:hypothetical protein
MKTLLTVSLLAIVAMVLAVPTVAQLPGPTPGPPPGFYVYWNINLHSPTPGPAVGSAHYYIAKPTLHQPPTPKGLEVYSRLSVECEYFTFPDLTLLDVFVGPGKTPNEPFGKVLGKMQVMGGSAVMLTARPPAVNKGTTVTIVHNGVAVMQGRF